jgi:molybdopterin-guanine dinucleotide biosynthesis protein A
MSSNPAISIAILCGGKSKRFGTDCKILHKISDKFMFQIIHDNFQNFTNDIFLQLSTEIKSLLDQNIDSNKLGEYRLYLDLIENKGPLAGIYSALVNAKNSSVFVVAADLPFTDSSILIELLKYDDHQLVIPQWSSGYYEPLCAVYSVDLLSLIKNHIEQDKLSIHELFENNSEINVKYINIDELIETGVISQDCFKNINRIRDL